MNYIWITTNFEGYHSYIDAPKEKSFLKNMHRHIFYVKVFIEIYHNDRDIEFLLFKDFVDKIINENDLNDKSCEMISDILAAKIQNKYKSRNLIIEISEDNENGCRKEYYI